jgi:hypothetical protein
MTRALTSVRQFIFAKTIFSKTALCAGIAAAALTIAASANAATLCPNQATVGGFGNTSSNVTGPLDGTCGLNSAVKIDIADSTKYGKLQFQSNMPNFPAGVTLGNVVSASANVAFSGNNQPYFLLPFIDSSNSLGQASATDQILFIEFQPATLVGNTLAFDRTTTLFNLYDNDTGTYLQGGQAVTNTLDGWLALHPGLAGDLLQGIWVAEGLTAGNSGPESLTVNSLDVTAAAAETPLPAALPLFASGLGVMTFIAGRRRKRKALATA